MSPPRISIGLPIRNGEKFLREALDSLLSQTIQDVEIVIADNASTDSTEQICREYESRDPRIKYVRREVNKGIIDNFNFVFKESRGEFFKWAAADDLCGPRFLELCLNALDADPETALAFCSSTIRYYGTPEDIARMAADGQTDSSPIEFNPDLHSNDPTKRFVAVLKDENVGTIIYGLIRREALLETKLHQKDGSDRLLLAELALRGKLVMLESKQFIRRVDTHSFDRSRRDYVRLVKGTDVGRLLTPPWRWPVQYLKAIKRSELSDRDKRSCRTAVIKRTLHLKYLSRLIVPGPENYWGFGGIHDDSQRLNS